MGGGTLEEKPRRISTSSGDLTMLSSKNKRDRLSRFGSGTFRGSSTPSLMGWQKEPLNRPGQSPYLSLDGEHGLKEVVQSERVLIGRVRAKLILPNCFFQ